MNSLQRNTKRQYGKYVGRGGKRGKTSGRGTKGQNARAGRKKYPEIRDMIKRIPKLRGRGKNSNKSIQSKPVEVKLSDLVKLTGEINVKVLMEKGIVSSVNGKAPEVKILANGEAPKNLIISGCKISKGAKDAIEKAGGKVNN